MAIQYYFDNINNQLFLIDSNGIYYSLEIDTNGNLFSSVSGTSTPNGFLPISGGTITGNVVAISGAGIFATLLSGTTISGQNINMAEVTRASIGTPGTGNISIFSDVNDNAIRVRQNSGLFATVTNQYINVKDWGAVGDGVTDDTIAIQTALSGVATYGFRGAEVLFPPGVYAISSTLLVPSTSTRIKGVTRGASTILPSSTFLGGDIFQCGAGTEFIEFRNLEIFSSVQRGSGAGINTNGANDVIIDDVNFNNMFNAVNINGGSIKVSISNCTIGETTYVSGVSIVINNGAAGDTYIGPNIISSNNGGHPAASIKIIQTGHTSINRCNFTSAVCGLLVQPAISGTVNYLFIDHSLFDSNASGAAVFDASLLGAQIRSLKSVNAWYAGSTSNEGIKFMGTPSGTMSDLTFADCRILNNGTNGVTLNYGSGISFQNCTIAGNSQLATGASDGIQVASGVGAFIIEDNLIGQAGTAGNTQRYGINLLAGANLGGIIVTDNNLALNVSGSMIDLSTVTSQTQKVIKDNIGHLYHGLISSITSSATVTAATNNIIVGGSGLTACPIPINSPRVGDVFRYTINGSFTGTATSTAVQVHLGPSGNTVDNTILTSSFTGAVGTTQSRIVGDFTFRTVGTAGTVEGTTLVTQIGTSGISNVAVNSSLNTTTTAPNTVQNNYLTISILSATGGTSGTVQSAYIEKL